MKNNIIIGIAIVLVLAVGGFFIFQSPENSSFDDFDFNEEDSKEEFGIEEKSTECEGDRITFDYIPADIDKVVFLEPMGGRSLGRCPQHRSANRVS